MASDSLPNGPSSSASLASSASFGGDAERFETPTGFEAGETSGGVRLGKFEAMYEELFAEVIEDGVITQDERKQLDAMADSLGLDRSRLRRLEQALQAAWEARHRVVIKDLTTGEDAPAPTSLQPLGPATDGRAQALERRVRTLEARVKELETELEEARAHASVDVDVSDFGGRSASLPPVDDDPADLARRVRHDPRDVDSLHALFRSKRRAGDGEGAAAVAHVLAFLGAAEPAEAELRAATKPTGLIKPQAAVSLDSWRRLLLHPEQEPLVGEMLSVVASAVLLGRVSAMRRDKSLPRVDPAQRQEPAGSTVQAVRCVAWAASLLGMPAPGIFVDPSWDGSIEIVPAVPPVTRLGRRALSGRSAGELAFLAGRLLARFRAEHFVQALVPSAKGLEEIFLAALSIGNPGMPLASHVKEQVVPIAQAIEPILEPASVDQLRGQFLRFVEEGGRVNLGRWAQSVERTCARAGLLLADDLGAAHRVLVAEDEAKAGERMDDLLRFVLSDRWSKLRKQIGIAVA